MKKDFKPIHDENNIKGFFGEYEFLSNFYPRQMIYDDILYASSENAYQAQKTLDIELRKKIASVSAYSSKKMGKALQLRPDWETPLANGIPLKVSIMFSIVYEKFIQNQDLLQLLLQTGNKHLEESNWWGDKIYGTYNGVGENWLGRILMHWRNFFRQ